MTIQTPFQNTKDGPYDVFSMLNVLVSSFSSLDMFSRQQFTTGSWHFLLGSPLKMTKAPAYQDVWPQIMSPVFFSPLLLLMAL